jgi:hypothetical protein
VACTCRHLRTITWEAVPGMKLLLFPHQRAALKWMLSREGAQLPQRHPLARRLETRGGRVAWADLAGGDVQVGAACRRLWVVALRCGGGARADLAARWWLLRRPPASSPSHQPPAPPTACWLQVEQPEDVRPSRGGMFCDEPVSHPPLAHLPAACLPPLHAPAAAGLPPWLLPPAAPGP